MKLGDAIEAFAKPIAKGIDSTLGTDLQNCGGCKGRQAWLNGLSDAVVDIFSRRGMAEDTSNLEWIVTKTRSILVSAASAEEADGVASRGEGQVMSLNTQVQPKTQGPQARPGMPPAMMAAQSKLAAPPGR